MKSLQLILLLAITPVACKKDKIAPDFRKEYAGTYTVTRTTYHSTGPGGRFGTGGDTIAETLIVSYKPTDSLECYDQFHKKPALMFRFDSDSVLVGVDATGKLYMDPPAGAYESGGFIGTDSKSYEWRDLHMTRTEAVTLSGKRK